MKKLIVSLSLMVGVFTSFAVAGPRDNASAGGLFHTTLGASGTVFTGAGTAYELMISTGDSSAWFVLLDSSVITGASYNSFTSTQAITPQIVFSSVSVTGVPSVNQQPIKLGGDYGYRANNGLYVHMVGAGNRVTVLWRK
mgnify:CR=1 FL=1